MERRYFYVTPLETGWEVREDQTSNVLAPYFCSSADALVAAVESARHAWESLRVSSGVRVQDPHGQWRDEVTFGSGLPVFIRKLARLTRQHPALRSV
jgi:hypothetical protein